MMIFKHLFLSQICALLWFLFWGLPFAWSMGGGHPNSNTIFSHYTSQIKAHEISEYAGYVFIRFKRELISNTVEVVDENSLLADGMFFVNDTIVRMVQAQCPDNNNVNNIKVDLNGSVPLQGVDDNVYYYIFSVNQSQLLDYIKFQCQ